MPVLLKIVGGVWAAFGAGNIVLMDWLDKSIGVLTFGLIFNMVLFILPGLVLYGVGVTIEKRRGRDDKSKSSNEYKTKGFDLSDRLSKLDELKSKGLIDDTEYDQKRKEIISEV